MAITPAPHVWSADGSILVQGEVFNFFSAIFHGHHVAAADAARDPVDSGVPFTPDQLAFPRFLDGLTQLSAVEHGGLEVLSPSLSYKPLSLRLTPLKPLA